MNLTRKQILDVMPRAIKTVDRYLPYLNAHMEECNINTRERVCHFLANIAIESDELTAVEENLRYSAKGLMTTFPKYFPTLALARSYEYHPQQIANRVYANRYGNGNEASGDGWRFRGRGLIQYTFRANYREYSRWCGFDVEKDPDLLANPKGAVRSACHYFEAHKCNTMADKGGGNDVIKAIRKAVNGAIPNAALVTKYRIFYDRAKIVIR
jgi:putative chitinase